MVDSKARSAYRAPHRRFDSEPYKIDADFYLMVDFDYRSFQGFPTSPMDSFIRPHHPIRPVGKSRLMAPLGNQVARCYQSSNDGCKATCSGHCERTEKLEGRESSALLRPIANAFLWRKMLRVPMIVRGETRWETTRHLAEGHPSTSLKAETWTFRSLSSRDPQPMRDPK